MKRDDGARNNKKKTGTIFIEVEFSYDILQRRSQILLLKKGW